MSSYDVSAIGSGTGTGKLYGAALYRLANALRVGDHPLERLGLDPAPRQAACATT